MDAAIKNAINRMHVQAIVYNDYKNSGDEKSADIAITTLYGMQTMYEIFTGHTVKIFADDSTTKNGTYLIYMLLIKDSNGSLVEQINL